MKNLQKELPKKKPKVETMLGFAQKAGKVVSGENAVKAVLRSKRIFLLLLAKDASGRCEKEFKTLAEYHQITLIKWGTKEQLGSLLGKTGVRACLAVTDQNFAQQIQEITVHENQRQ